MKAAFTMESISDIIEAAKQAFRQREFSQAEELYRQALAIEPENAGLFFSLGGVLSELDRDREASGAFRKAVALKPKFAEAHHNLGRMLKRIGRTDEAISHLKRALELQPEIVDFWISLGVTYAESGQMQEAIEHLRQAVRLQPENAQAHHNLGVALLEFGSSDEAIESLQHALKYRPDYSEALFNLGSALVQSGKHEEGIEHFYRVLKLKPDHSGAYNNLGLALKDESRLEEAVVILQQAARLDKKRPEPYNNLGLAYTDLGRFREAFACFEQALEIDPFFVDAHANLGSAYKEQGRLDEGIACYDMALRMEPDSASTRWNRSLAWLQQGDFQRGWPAYEWRWRRGKGKVRPFAKPIWDGSSLSGRTILLHMEQGLGDMLQFIRYATRIEAMGGTVIVECPKSIMPLFSTCSGIDRLVAEGDELPSYDVHAPLMSLPGLLGTTLETVPASVPYLFADDRKQKEFERELSKSSDFKVGLCWQGNPQHPWDRHRSIPLSFFAPLAEVDGVRLYSLQKEDGCEQISRVDFSVTQLSDELDANSDAFVDTAAIIANINLVITVDTSIAHLAGALGAEVWLALSDISDWRWMRNRNDSPWFPTMRLFRQKRLGDWEGVIDRIALELKKSVESIKRAGTVYVEVSAGELIDKISILEIKSERIADSEKLKHVLWELESLTTEQSRSVTGSDRLAQLTAELKIVNEKLWDVEDELRRLESQQDFREEFIELARSVYRINDGRSDIKRQIDELVGSRFSEQKQHPEYD